MRQKDWFQIIRIIVIFILVSILVFPIYWMINTSLGPRSEIYVYPPRLVHPNPSLASYTNILFGDRPIFTWFKNSLIVALVSTIFSVLISTLAGYSISRFSIRGSQLIGISLLVSRMLPSTMLVIPLFFFFSKINLIDKQLSIIIANTTFIIPFATWMLKGYFDSIPPEIEEAAQIDGCGHLSALFRVVLPVTAPGIAATILYAIILSWNEFVFARTFLNSSTNWTITVGLASFKGEYITYWNEIMAASLVSSLPIVIMFIFLEKYLVSGLSSGAVK